MVNKIFIKKFIVPIAIFVLILPIGVWALGIVEEGFLVNNSEVAIDAHGTCKKVKANDGREYFVPTKGIDEWSSFLENTPVGMTLSECIDFSDQVEFITSFSCPNPYHYMRCGLVGVTDSITSDGGYIYAFEDGYNGSYSSQKLHIYKYNKDTKSVSLVETIKNLGNYPKWIESFAINSDGSRILLTRRQDVAGGTSSFYIYAFDGVNANLLYTGSYKGGFSHNVSAINEDGTVVAFQGRIYEKNGSTYDEVFDNGFHGALASNDPQQSHIGANLYLGDDSFYLFKREGRGDIVQKQSDGSWQVIQSILPSVNNKWQASFAAVSNDYSLMAINSKKDSSSNYKSDIYKKNESGPGYTKLGTIDLGDLQRHTVEFSAAGRYFISAGKTWNIDPMLEGGSPIVVKSTANWMDSYSTSQFGYAHENSLGDIVVARPDINGGAKFSGKFYIYKRLPN